jgi:purine-binding chemotaxis protein CheW
MSDLDSVDWSQLLHELDWDNDTRHEEAVRTRLKQRAAQYASQSKITGEDAETTHTLLAFELSGERYGVEVVLVRHVRSIDKITPVPGIPSFYPGVVNIRGKVLTVLDLRQMFNMQVDTAKPPQELVVVNVNALEIGVLVHHVQDVVTIRESEIEPLEDVRYARGMAPNRLIFLDFTRLFEDERLIVGGMDE